MVRIYAIVPKVAQDSINASSLNLVSLELSEPASESIRFKQKATLGSKSSFHPDIDSFNASLSIDEPNAKPFAALRIPDLKNVRDGTVIDVDQQEHIHNVTAFTEFNKVLLANETVKLWVKGKPKLHEGKLPTQNVDFNDVVHMKGFNGLQGFNLTSFNILLDAEPDGTNMIGEALIPNPTVLTISMVCFFSCLSPGTKFRAPYLHCTIQGNVTFQNFVDTTLLGVSHMKDLTLRPGNNTYPMRSVINQTLVATKLLNYTDGILPVTVIGNGSVYHGQRLSYFEDALASQPLTLHLNVAAALGQTR